MADPRRGGRSLTPDAHERVSQAVRWVEAHAGQVLDRPAGVRPTDELVFVRVDCDAGGGLHSCEVVYWDDSAEGWATTGARGYAHRDGFGPLSAGVYQARPVSSTRTGTQEQQDHYLITGSLSSPAAALVRILSLSKTSGLYPAVIVSLSSAGGSWACSSGSGSGSGSYPGSGSGSGSGDGSGSGAPGGIDGGGGGSGSGSGSGSGCVDRYTPDSTATQNCWLALVSKDMTDSVKVGDVHGAVLAGQYGDYPLYVKSDRCDAASGSGSSGQTLYLLTGLCLVRESQSGSGSGSGGGGAGGSSASWPALYKYGSF